MFNFKILALTGCLAALSCAAHAATITTTVNDCTASPTFNSFTTQGDWGVNLQGFSNSNANVICTAGEGAISGSVNGIQASTAAVSGHNGVPPFDQDRINVKVTADYEFLISPDAVTATADQVLFTATARFSGYYDIVASNFDAGGGTSAGTYEGSILVNNLTGDSERGSGFVGASFPAGTFTDIGASDEVLTISRYVDVGEIFDVSLSLFALSGTSARGNSTSPGGGSSSSRAFASLEFIDFSVASAGYCITSGDAAFDSCADVSPAPVPLPASAWLLGAGVMGLVRMRKRS